MTTASPPDETQTPFGPERVLHRTAELVAIDKPSGLLVHNSHWAGPREVSLRELVMAHLDQEVFPLHRLDRGTSGVVVFACRRSDVAALQAALAAPTTDKRYLALVRGRDVPLGLVNHPLRSERGESVPARTEVVSASSSTVERVSLVEARIDTGRTHQVRRHLAHLRHPVVGDSNHGDTKFNRTMRETRDANRLMLHAWKLRLGEGGAALDVTAPLPADFQSVLDAVELDVP